MEDEVTKNKVMKNRITLGNIRCKKFLHTLTNLYIGETEEKESVINMSKVFIVEEYSMIDERTLSVIDYLYYYPYNKDRRHKDFFDGHSWASGIYQHSDGKEQESSSEVFNFNRNVLICSNSCM